MDVRVNEFFQVQTANITRGHNYTIIKPVCNNNARQFSFSCRRINCWNSLTQTIVNAHSVAAFIGDEIGIANIHFGIQNSASLEIYIVLQHLV